MSNYTLDTEADLSTIVEVYDETLGLFYPVDIEVCSVPIQGWMTETFMGFFQDSETDGAATIDLDPNQLMDLIEEQDDGRVFGPTVVILDSNRSIHDDIETSAQDYGDDWQPE